MYEITQDVDFHARQNKILGTFRCCSDFFNSPPGSFSDPPHLENLATHRSPKAAAILKDIGAWFLFLPPYSPDPGSPPLSQGQAPGQALNPIEIIRAFSRTNGVHALIFAKLKALIRKAAARTYDQIWKAVGQVCDLFKEEECYNFFKAAGYQTD